MKFEPVTIKDIAKALGLSSSTISKALRDSYEISAETKELVSNYAKKVNYSPNPMAVGLKEKRTRSIGLIVCDLSNSFFSQVIDGMDEVAGSKGYNVIIAQSRDAAEREEQDLKFLTSRGIDGILISVTSENADHKYLEYLHQRGLPVVLFDRIAPGIETHKISIDNHSAGYKAAEHLLQNDFKKIAVLASSAKLTSTKERLRGYKEAMAAFGIETTDHLIFHCEAGGRSSAEVGSQLKELFSKGHKPDAVITMSERITIESLRHLKRMKMSIPADIAIVGFSNHDISELTEPGLTIIRQPAFEVGKMAMTLLLELVESKKPITSFKTEVLKPVIITRDSSAKTNNI